MKKYIVFILLTTALFSCGETKVEESATEVEEELGADMLYANLIDLDQRLVKADMTVDKKVANELYAAANDFSKKFPEHEKTADALELAAKSAEALEKFNDAINILHKLTFEFEETDKTPSYMYNKARILEERMGKKDNAKAAYKELVDRFPEHPLAISAKQYLDMNYMDMSDAELIEFLEKQNQDAE